MNCNHNSPAEPSTNIPHPSPLHLSFHLTLPQYSATIRGKQWRHATSRIVAQCRNNSQHAIRPITYQSNAINSHCNLATMHISRCGCVSRLWGGFLGFMVPDRLGPTPLPLISFLRFYCSSWFQLGSVGLDAASASFLYCSCKHNMFTNILF